MKKALNFSYAVFSIVCIVCAAVGVPLAAAENPPQITVIDNAVRVRLPNSTHPLVASASDMGQVDPNLRLGQILLILGPADAMQTTLQTFLDSLHDKNSENYHRWLTPEQFGERFGPSQADLDKIAAWLQQQGFDSIKISPGRSQIKFSGSAQIVEHAFQTQMHLYRRGSDIHLANNSDIAIPKALAGLVRGVNLQNFSFSKPALAQVVTVRRDAATGRWSPIKSASDFTSETLIDPNDFAKIYDLDRVYSNGTNGQGETIAIVARTTVELSDVEAFRESFHLPPNDPNIILNGPQELDPPSLDTLEASLDAEWAGAVAPAATVHVVASASTGTTDGVVLSSAYIVDNNLADVMGVSFEECEADLGASNSLFNALWAQAAAQGMSVFVAAGDQGAAGCDAGTVGEPAQNGLAVNGLASTPFNTAVGGTAFNDTGNYPQFWNLDGVDLSAIGYIPENVWNESCDPAQTSNCSVWSLDAGGGGVSTQYTKPAWQSTSVSGVPNDSARDVPDVSLTAANHDGYLICVSVDSPCTFSTLGDQVFLLTATGVGGTSASTQAFAGIMALIDQKQGGRQGLANYGLYRLAANETFANCNSSNRTDPNLAAPPECTFNDITTGNNGVPGNDTLGANPPPGNTTGQLGYNAVSAYDLASGLGSVDGFNLVKAWTSLAFSGSATALSASSSTSVQHGQAVAFSVNVTALSGTAVPTGSVGLIAKTSTPFSTGIGVGGGTLVNGIFSGSVNSLPGGQYNVVAHYAGDGNFAPSDSNAVSVDVSAENSSLTVTSSNENGNPQSSPATAGYGDPFTVAFNVRSASDFGNPTGTVTLFDGGKQVAQAAVGSGGSAGVVNCISVGFCLGFGSHSLTASYSGDSSLKSSTTAHPFVYNIVKGTPSIVTSAFGNQTWVELVANFLQSSLPIFPTGTLTFSDNFNGQTSTLRSYTVTRDQISDFFPLAPGNHAITVQYSGDTNYLPETLPYPSIAMPALVGLPTQVSVTLPTNSVGVGLPVSLTATVTSSQSSATPTGSVHWISAGGGVLNPSQTIELTNGSVTIQMALPGAGPIIAIYSGDSIFAPSASISVQPNATKATPALSISSNLPTATPAEQVTITAALIPPPGARLPQGTVQFFDAFNGAASVVFGVPQSLAINSSEIGTALVAIPANLPLGTHLFTASYSGDFNYNPVAATSFTSAAVSVVATPPTNPVSPNFGTIDVGSTSGTQSVNVLFSASGTPSAIAVLAQGSIHSNFAFVDQGTCVTGTPFSAGQSCMVDVTLAPDFSGTNMGAVLLADLNGNVLGTQYVFGQGTAPQIAFDFGTPSPLASTVGSLNDAEFLAADRAGNFFIADNGNQRVIKVPPVECLTSNCQTVVASSANGLAGADGVVVDGAGNLYVSDSVSSQVVMIPPGCVATACTRVIASQSSGEISTPRKLAVDGAGDLFIADLNNSRVVEVPAGCTSRACQKILGTGLNSVYGVAVDAAGNVFISDFGNGQVVKLPPGCIGGSCQSTLVSGLVGPKGISLDAAGNLYIAENTQIVEVSAADGSQRILATGASLGASGNPTDVALGPAGTVLIADPSDLQVAILNRGNPPQTYPGTTAFGTMSAPQEVIIENIGTQSLNLAITPTTNTALDPATTTCASGSAVAPGAFCQLGVEFAPAMLGNPISGKVTIADNTRNQSDATQNILVSGNVANGQTINFPPLPNSVTLGVAPITLQATATSGLPVSYSATGPASISGSTLTILGSGSVSITANQAGNASFAAAAPVSQTITVNPQVNAGFTLTPSKQSLALHAGQPGAVIITVTPSGGFDSQVSFSCGQPTLATCSFTPQTLTPNGGPLSTTLTVTASSAVADLRAPAMGSKIPLALAFVSAFASFAIGTVLVAPARCVSRNRVFRVLCALLAGLVITFLTGCGNGGTSSGGGESPQPQTGIITVSASAGANSSHSFSLTITVTP